MPVIEVNGIPLNHTVTGSGPPVVLVMGAGATGRVWHLHQQPALVDAGFRVVTFDNRGIAGSGGGGEFTIDDLVADTAGLIEHLDLGPCRVVGTSLGAQVVQELALARPDLVTHAVMMATRGRDDAMRAAMRRAEQELRAAGVEPPRRHDAIVRALKNLSPRTLNDDVAVRDWLDIFELSPPLWNDGMRTQLTLGMEESRLEAYRGITAPSLVIGFADDLTLPPHLAREVAEAIPGARYEELDGCGHYGYLERPDEVNALLLKFFGA
jgi:pimeloyl-ACP methyl ester carboxylesterase